MSKFHVGMGDAYNFVAWAMEMHPEVFNQWKAVMEVQRSVDPDDIL